MDVLFIPSVKKGNGIGHLKRCIKYVSESSFRSFIYIPEDYLLSCKEDSAGRQLLSPLIKNNQLCSVIDRKYDIIVTDKRKTSISDFEKYSEMSELLIGMDEGGEKREYYPYLIDTLPSLLSHKANFMSTGLLEITDKRFSSLNKPVTVYDKILVSFGGEDPENLTAMLLNIFSEDKYYEDKEITVIQGPLFTNPLEKKENIEIIIAPPSLESFIDKSDIVICSFGITALEALYAGKAVILVNPSEYHSKLSRKAGIPEVGITTVDKKLLKKYFLQTDLLQKNTIINLDPPLSFDKLLSDIKLSGLKKCPFCSSESIPLARFKKRNYYCCRTSSLVYMKKFSKNSIDYGRNYFFDDYKEQYGKTYLEDFNNIRRISDQRVEILKKHKEKGSLLDVGCAYGPFLKSSDEAGYKSHGIDISPDAVDYVINTLGIDAINNDFAEWDINTSKQFDIITMWYVLEHFTEPDKIIDKVCSLLPPGGIFAFSTPDFTGISGKRDWRKTLFMSPGDHYTFWSIKSASIILKSKNFKILEIRNTGHHPERFNRIIKKIFPYSVLKHISILLKLGDTFEIYAEKQVY